MQEVPIAKTTRIGDMFFCDMADGASIPVFYGSDDNARWIGNLDPQDRKKHKYHFGSYELRMSVRVDTFEELVPLIEQAILTVKL